MIQDDCHQSATSLLQVIAANCPNYPATDPLQQSQSQLKFLFTEMSLRSFEMLFAAPPVLFCFGLSDPSICVKDSIWTFDEVNVSLSSVFWQP